MPGGPTECDADTPFGYTGQYQDNESGLLYLRARYYDPATEQFISRDPLEQKTRQPYVYAYGNPVNYVDPSGLEGGSNQQIRPSGYIGSKYQLPPGRTGDPRMQPGIATGGENLPVIQGRWLRGTQGNAGRFPGQIADQLRGRMFSNFREFRRAFWRAVAADPELSKGWRPSNLVEMHKGNAPFAMATQQHNGWAKDRYTFHHIQPINQGGGLYDMDNMVIATPRYHVRVFGGP